MTLVDEIRFLSRMYKRSKEKSSFTTRISEMMRCGDISAEAHEIVSIFLNEAIDEDLHKTEDIWHGRGRRSAPVDPDPCSRSVSSARC